MERKVSLKGKSEWAGARKILRHLKNARMLKGRVRLESTPAPRKKANPKRRRRNIAGFMGPDGVFHPIRSGQRATYTPKGKRVLLPAKTAYSRKKAGERARPKSRTKPARRRTAKKRNTTYASFRAQGRRTKKQEFLRRMRLGKLRAARSRKR